MDEPFTSVFEGEQFLQKVQNLTRADSNEAVCEMPLKQLQNVITRCVKLNGISVRQSEEKAIWL